MTGCSVRWRPSGGRGEFEFVPADSLADRRIFVDFDALNVRVDSEVEGRHLQGKPRLRKLERHNQDKMHLPQLVMAIACLPEPMRQDKGDEVPFPLENERFVIDKMNFEIVEDDGLSVVLYPIDVSIFRTDISIDLVERIKGISKDWNELKAIEDHDPTLLEKSKCTEPLSLNEQIPGKLESAPIS